MESIILQEQMLEAGKKPSSENAMLINVKFNSQSKVSQCKDLCHCCPFYQFYKSTNCSDAFEHRPHKSCSASVSIFFESLTNKNHLPKNVIYLAITYNTIMITLDRLLHNFILLHDDKYLPFQDILWPNGTKLRIFKEKVAKEYDIKKNTRFFFAHANGQRITTSIR